jgi:hypothetical protein
MQLNTYNMHSVRPVFMLQLIGRALQQVFQCQAVKFVTPTPDQAPVASRAQLRNHSDSQGRLWNCMLLALAIVPDICSERPLGLDNKCKH